MPTSTAVVPITQGNRIPIGHDSVMAPERFFYSTSYAFGTPDNRLKVRSEIRYDKWGDALVFDDRNERAQVGFGVSAIVKY